MVAHVATVALNGVDATLVDVQVQVTSGTPAVNLVGLPNNAVKESKERIRSAFHALGIKLPAKRITINLAPADVLKEGSHYDLPIAVGMLVAMGVVPSDAAERTLVMGEVGLDGHLHVVTGALPAAIFAQSEGLNSVVVPEINAAEAAWAEGVDVLGFTSLQQWIYHVTGQEITPPVQAKLPEIPLEQTSQDFSDIRGQESAKRAAEIAAAGGHNLLLSGPPGSGKSMLAQRMMGILPPLMPAEALDVSMIHSVAGTLGREGLLTQRPFRDPHHSASSVALTGGGMKAKPGEMSLAHRGVLFLDELPEFPRQVLETLRQPLETGTITVSRANRHVTYPARFQLVAAMNPCPCGHLGDAQKPCKCSPTMVERYQSRLSGPLLDRFDLHVSVPAVKAADMALPPAKETSQTVAARVMQARQVQAERYAEANVLCNAELSGKLLDKFCAVEEDSRQVLEMATTRLGLSARAYHRILKVARTIADLEAQPAILRQHVVEALAYRGA